jgi:hypothetical protein
MQIQLLENVKVFAPMDIMPMIWNILVSQFVQLHILVMTIQLLKIVSFDAQLTFMEQVDFALELVIVHTLQIQLLTCVFWIV